MRFLCAVLGVLVAVSVPTACGGSDALSKGQYVSRLNAMCQDFSKREKTIGDPQTVEDLVEKGPRVVDAFEKAIVDKIHKLKAPDEIADQANRLADLADEQRDVLRRLVDAAKRSDFAKVKSSPRRTRCSTGSPARSRVSSALPPVPSQEQRAAAFRALHEGDPFVIPNPWDAGSARVLAALGFEALATTSSGFAFTLGRLDGNVTLDEVVQHVTTLVGATDLPLSVDLENGFGAEPESAALAVTRVAEAGAVGGSIEDYDPAGHIYDLPHAVERVAAAVEAARRLDWPFTLTARAENHIHGNPDLDDTITRLQAFEAAGADVLYAPGLQSPAEIRAVCEAVSKPVNVLARPGLSLAEIVDAGAQRISVGGSLAWTAVNALAAAATEIRDRGDFSSLGDSSRLREWLA